MKILVPKEEFEFHFGRFVEECKNMLVSHYSSKFSNLDVPSICVSEGSKYLKVYREENNLSSYVWFFVDGEGNIWKPASWKGPVKNFPRGNIIQDSAADVIGVYGI